MSDPIYKVGDMVRIVKEPWTQHAGDIVILTRCEVVGDTPIYEWVIPESRGSVPQHLIERVVAHDMKVP